MSNAYISLSTLKGSAGLDIAGSAYDTRLVALLENVSREIDRYCERYFYFVQVGALRRERALYGERLVGYAIPRARSIDIDEPAHLALAEALLAVNEEKPAGRPVL